MAVETHNSPLDPIDRQSEIMFGLLMTLTFTGTMSASLGAGATVREILIAALGCNIAWGIVDATVYLLTTAADRARGLARAAAVRAAPDDEALRLLRGFLPDPASRSLSDAEVLIIIGRLRSLPPERARVLGRDDYRAAFQVFLMVTGATLPPILPFLLVDSVPLAMRLSNGIAILMLIYIGWRLDRQISASLRWLTWIVPVIGIVMVIVTIVLGG
jgi:hypothetical protein